MSTMADTLPKSRRPRRQFDEDFKAQAVRLVLDEGKTVPTVARDLDLTETALREWVHRARANRTCGRTGPDPTATRSGSHSTISRVARRRSMVRFLAIMKRYALTVSTRISPGAVQARANVSDATSSASARFPVRYMENWKTSGQ
jgi:transposase